MDTQAGTVVPLCRNFHMRVYHSGLEVHIPHDQRPGHEIVCPFVGHVTLGGAAVIVLAADFHRKDRGTFEKAHTGWFARVEGRIRAEGLPMG